MRIHALGAGDNCIDAAGLCRRHFLLESWQSKIPTQVRILGYRLEIDTANPTA